jgi:hypothetical protein
MWWEPHTEHEYLLWNAVTQLRDWFRAQSNETTPVSCGVGSGWSYDLESLVPLVLFNIEIFTLDRPADITPFPITRVRELGFPPNRTLPQIDTSLPIYCLVVSRPQPSDVTQKILDSYLEIRDLIICEQTVPARLGTAGVAVWDQILNSYGLLTAGHIFRKGVGSLVKRQRWKLRLWQQREYLGVVSHHVVPQHGVAWWDAAVIRPEKAIKPRRSVNRRMLKRLDQPEPIVVHGALSGSVSQAAALQGALVEGGAGNTKWMNCWMVAPTGVLTSGDSGAAVFTRKNEEFLGVYVGASTIGADESPLIHYVQDGYSLEQNVFKGWQVRFA